MKMRLVKVLAVFVGALALLMPEMAFAANCDARPTFLGMKPWYQYLDLTETSDGKCEIAESNFSQDNATTTIWKIILTILSDITFLVGVAAVGMVIYSGVRYITAFGNVGAAALARRTMVGAIIGLVVTILATTIVNIILGLF